MAKVNVNIYSTTSVMVTLRIIRRATAAATIIYSRIYVVVLQRQHPGQRGNGAALHPLKIRERREAPRARSARGDRGVKKFKLKKNLLFFYFFYLFYFFFIFF